MDQVTSETRSRDSAERVEFVRQALPEEGLFADKTWRISPEPFTVDAALHKRLEGLGGILQRFVRAANKLYLDSAAGIEPTWIAEYLDLGKPEELIEHARNERLAKCLPRVIRPDVLLTESGFVITELDSVPGGIGMTAWLNETYSKLGFDVVGGQTGMLAGFHGIAPSADILVSKESSDYRPEMEWLVRKIQDEIEPSTSKVCDAETYEIRGPLASNDDQNVRRILYRFFELFDLPNIEVAKDIMKAEAAREVVVTAPFKPHLEEKAWFALFWMRPLRNYWLKELGNRNLRLLQQVIPYTWIIDPASIRHNAALPMLDAHCWSDVAEMSQRDRNMVIKISGFHEDAWGSRSVVVGSDVSQKDWADTIEESLADFHNSPRILQVFHKTKSVEQPYYCDTESRIKNMVGRVRLCPYYFVLEGRAEMRGILSTICPADKKIIHGMQDAILAPVTVAG